MKKISTNLLCISKIEEKFDGNNFNKILYIVVYILTKEMISWWVYTYIIDIKLFLNEISIIYLYNKYKSHGDYFNHKPQLLLLSV